MSYRERLEESVLLKSRRGGLAVVAVTTTLLRGARIGPSSPSTHFFLLFPQPGLLRKGAALRLLLISGAIVVCCPALSAGARNPVTPHSQGGLMLAADHTQGVQPSYSSAKFSKRVASLII